MKLNGKFFFIGLFLIIFCLSVIEGQEARKDSEANYKQIVINPSKLSKFIPQEIPRRGEEKPQEKGRKLGSLEKSLLFPGWGQISEKRYIRGLTFMFSEAACLSSAVVYAVKGSHSYDNYRDAANTPDAIHYRQLTERYDKRRNISLVAGAVVWAVNLLDMSLSRSKPKDTSEGKINKKQVHLHFDVYPADEYHIQFILLF